MRKGELSKSAIDNGWPYQVEEVRGLAQSVSTFAESFATKELIATNGTFESIATKQLCAIKSDGNQVCLTGDQLGALLSQTSSAATSISVPSSPSNTREPEATSTPTDLTNSEQSDNANWTPPPSDNSHAYTNSEPANDNPPPAEASSTSQAAISTSF